MVICLERGADLHMAQPMPLPLTVSCFSKMQIGFTFLVPAHPGSPRKRAVKRVCACVSTSVSNCRDITSVNNTQYTSTYVFLIVLTLRAECQPGRNVHGYNSGTISVMYHTRPCRGKTSRSFLKIISLCWRGYQTGMRC